MSDSHDFSTRLADAGKISPKNLAREIDQKKPRQTVAQFVKHTQAPRTHFPTGTTKKKTAVRARYVFGRKEKRALISLADRFMQWCALRFGVEPEQFHSALHFPKPSADDWITRVTSDGRIQMNTHVASQCTSDAFNVICLHELAHVVLQGIPNKIDARQIKESYGDRVMVMFDIEADVLVAEFLRVDSGIDITDMFATYYDTGEVFADAQIRISKLERFLGTILTLVNAWVIERPHPACPHPVIVPSTITLLTDELLHLMEVRGSFKRMRHVQMALDEFAVLRRCYARNVASRNEFTSTLLGLGCRLLVRH